MKRDMDKHRFMNRANKIARHQERKWKLKIGPAAPAPYPVSIPA
jgi:hypothetical protein